MKSQRIANIFARDFKNACKVSHRRQIYTDWLRQKSAEFESSPLVSKLVHSPQNFQILLFHNVLPRIPTEADVFKVPPVSC